MMTEEQSKAWLWGVAEAALLDVDAFHRAVNDMPQDDDRDIVLVNLTAVEVLIQLTIPDGAKASGAFCAPQIQPGQSDGERLALQVMASMANDDGDTATALIIAAMRSEEGATALAEMFVMVTGNIRQVLRAKAGLATE